MGAAASHTSRAAYRALEVDDTAPQARSVEMVCCRYRTHDNKYRNAMLNSAGHVLLACRHGSVLRTRPLNCSVWCATSSGLQGQGRAGGRAARSCGTKDANSNSGTSTKQHLQWDGCTSSRERKQLHAPKVKVLGGSESSPRGFLTVTRLDLLSAIAMTTLPSCFSLFDKGRILTHTLTHSSFDFPSFTAAATVAAAAFSLADI